MEYKLFFLNNLHDSLDMVIAEVDSFLDICDMGDLHCQGIKHIILNLSNSFELVVKYRLQEEHWAFVFADLDKASFDDYINGAFISVDIKSGINRLKNICDVNFLFKSSMNIYKYRNRLIHYTLNGEFEQILRDIAGSMEEISNFVQKEIMDKLPKNAKDDFDGTIKDYKEKATALRALDLKRFKDTSV